ncbi:MAG: 2-C-methyl-D-erythritol 4-phosphate cytidylyltransferase [Lactobacillales bacterium]|jgi:2-C-methyl-D-erythritol 4-phosphate cytidylyltransferase|nr:2-C-methyl-D-erythritol 4-phosphate cytidylyltransferase [Lactobacillales bacterium]
MNYTAIILAGGSGSRMKAEINKIFLEIEGRQIIEHSVRIFEQDERCVNIVLVIKEKEVEQYRYLKNEYPHIQFVFGGAERQDSVYNALVHIKKTDYVLVHDGARPFVELDALDRLLDKLKTAHAAILAVPVKDTIKVVNKFEQITQTPDRAALWAAQTPQAFDFATLLTCHEKARHHGYIATDDAALIERYTDKHVVVALGSYENIKITTPIDLEMASLIAKKRF